MTVMMNDGKGSDVKQASSDVNTARLAEPHNFFAREDAQLDAVMHDEKLSPVKRLSALESWFEVLAYCAEVDGNREAEDAYWKASLLLSSAMRLLYPAEYEQVAGWMLKTDAITEPAESASPAQLALPEPEPLTCCDCGHPLRDVDEYAGLCNACFDDRLNRA